MLYISIALSQEIDVIIIPLLVKVLITYSCPTL